MPEVQLHVGLLPVVRLGVGVRLGLDVGLCVDVSVGRRVASEEGLEVRLSVELPAVVTVWLEVSVLAGVQVLV